MTRMTLQEQAWESGLVFSDDPHNNSDTPRWNSSDWPPLLDGGRCWHASVVLDHHSETSGNAQTVVVLGGYNQYDGYHANSVLLLNLAEENKQWREGPPLNNPRACHAAVVCNGGVYVMGGDCDYSTRLGKSIERIDVENLLQTYSTNTTTTGNPWTTLNCRLSTARDECSAVAVYNRYIVVMGGTDDGNCLSSVEIIDTKVQNSHTIHVGPSMTIPRAVCGSAVIGHRIFAVGGYYWDGYCLEKLNSVEYLEFQHSSGIDTRETAAGVFPSSCAWTTLPNMKLSVPGKTHVLPVGSCLLAMGHDKHGDEEVLDIYRNLVWKLPRVPAEYWCCSAVTFLNGIAVIGGSGNDSCATLPLMDKNTWCFRRLCNMEPNGWYRLGSKNDLTLA